MYVWNYRKYILRRDLIIEIYYIDIFEESLNVKYFWGINKLEDGVLFCGFFDL